MALYQSDRTIAFRHAYGKAAPPEKLPHDAFESKVGCPREVMTYQRLTSAVGLKELKNDER
jgi:hypothetical protein